VTGLTAVGTLRTLRRPSIGMNDTSSTNPMNDATRPRRGLGGGAILVGLCAFLAACDRAEEVESAAETASPPVRQQAAPLPGALYHTELTFVGREEQPSLLHLRFDNRTDSVSIVTRYRGWFGGAEWSEILDHADSLPVPRAAWRILPTGPVRMVAGEGGEPASLILALPDGGLRLDSRGSIGSWNSRTGQRESLHLAELQDDSGAESGLLLARQSARVTAHLPMHRSPPGPGSTRPRPSGATSSFSPSPPRRIRRAGGPSSSRRPDCWASCAAFPRRSWTLPGTDPGSTCSGCMRRSSSGASHGR
jgi:hypothetical protein